MSHFSVLVIVKEDERLEDILQPYHEYECTGVEDEYVVWVDEHDKYLEDFQEDTIPVVVDIDQNVVGRRYDADNPRIRPMYSDPMRLSGFELPEGYDVIRVPATKAFNSFDEYMEGWHNLDEGDKRNGRYGRLTNPNRKWDWWVIGGRYSNRLVSTLGFCGDTFWSNHVDFNAMRNVRLQSRMDWHDERNHYLNLATKAIEEVKGDAFSVFDEDGKVWKGANERFFDSSNEHRYKMLREVFGNLYSFYMWEIARRIAQQKKSFAFGLDIWDDVRLTLMPRHEFKEHERNQAMSFALLSSDIGWLQEGEMGWFGMVDKGEGSADYHEAWWEVVGNLPPSSEVYMVDCHI